VPLRRFPGYYFEGGFSLDRIAAGVRRFQSEVFPAKREIYEKLATEQRPHTLFITCGDSRVDPEVLTQSDPGEIFVERNPGNIVPDYNLRTTGGVSASIEFAVSALRVQRIIVCGHSDCGAMRGLLQPERVANLPAVSHWLDFSAAARNRLGQEMAASHVADPMRRLTELNVLQQIENLHTHPSVIDKLRENKLAIHGWFYEIHSGSVAAFNEKSDRFEAWPQ
jgi:carbonic anhydrase